MNEPLNCNMCGKEFIREDDIFKEDFLEVKKEWGYFSGKDLEQHSFYICEHCYNEWVRKFSIPVTKENVSEVL